MICLRAWPWECMILARPVAGRDRSGQDRHSTNGLGAWFVWRRQAVIDRGRIATYRLGRLPPREDWLRLAVIDRGRIATKLRCGDVPSSDLWQAVIDRGRIATPVANARSGRP